MAGAGMGVLAEPKLIAFLLARFACNNHTICDEELRVIGEVHPQQRDLTGRSAADWT